MRILQLTAPLLLANALFLSVAAAMAAPNDISAAAGNHSLAANNYSLEPRSDNKYHLASVQDRQGDNGAVEGLANINMAAAETPTGRVDRCEWQCFFWWGCCPNDRCAVFVCVPKATCRSFNQTHVCCLMIGKCVFEAEAEKEAAQNKAFEEKKLEGFLLD